MSMYSELEGTGYQPLNPYSIAAIGAQQYAAQPFGSFSQNPLEYMLSAFINAVPDPYQMAKNGGSVNLGRELSDTVKRYWLPEQYKRSEPFVVRLTQDQIRQHRERSLENP